MAVVRGWLVVVIVIGVAGEVAAEPGPPPPTTTPEIETLDKALSARQQLQDWFGAAKLARKVYVAQRALTGDDSVWTGRRKLALASALDRSGAYGEAIELYQEILAAAERTSGPDSEATRTAVGWLLGVYRNRRDYEHADALFERVLAISKKLYGDTSERYATELASYAWYMASRADNAAAQQAYEEALRIEDVAKADPRSTLSGLGMLYVQTGQVARAVAVFDRYAALATSEPVASRVGTLQWIAMIYRLRGLLDLSHPPARQAIGLCEREIARLEAANGPDAKELAPLLLTLGTLLSEEDDLAAADRVLSRVIALDEKLGAQPPYAQLANVRWKRARPQEALALFEHASADMQKYPGFATGMYPMMAELERELGHHKRAEQLYLAAQADLDKQLGKNAILVARLHLGLVSVYIGEHKLDRAERVLADNLAIAERELAMVLATGTEADHATYFAREAQQLDAAISFHTQVAPRSASAARLAMTTLLRRKGRVLDAAAAGLATIRGQLSPDDRALLDQLDDARARLSKLAVAGARTTQDFAREVATLEGQIRTLEISLGQKSAAYRVAHQPVELAAVQNRLPKDARLVDIASFEPRDWQASYPSATPRPRRYVAYVLASHGDPVAIDLGPVQPIDDAIGKLRAALGDPDNDRVVELGRALHDLTFAKLAPALGAAKHVLLAPDGALNLVPFAAVHDGKQYLIQRYLFTYLTSGRDLLRLGVRGAMKGGAIIFADPDFDDSSPAVPAARTRGRRATEMTGLHWPRLPGTAKEADALARTIAGATVYRERLATEGTLKALHTPSVLHLATHGFFLAQPSADATPLENPLLHSGLVFAGANRLSSGREDGVLTALEASGLDLFGTRLVVMSACETGLGKVTNGDGVYGLRRALVIAGTETVVMSLWQVDDLATRDLMAGYYQRLQAGEGRSAALRNVQLALLNNPRYAHPYYWASFVSAGDSSPLDR